ncbi:AraC family transcriptional regulator (plasmid) [Paraburkholderia caledonica]|nr:AraC family transcriptional regulator [Paraburkholderia caledonica]
MEHTHFPTTCFISTRVRHRITTVAMHDDTLVLVRRGIKTLLDSASSVAVKAGGSILLPRGSQWDVINDPATDGRYEAVILQFGDSVTADFQRMYAGEFKCAPMDGCFKMPPCKPFEEAVLRAADAIGKSETSPRLRHHRAMEVLLMLAERGCILRPRGEMTWPDRLHRVIAHRPHAAWSIERLARACHTSASTLRRRLADHNVTVGGLVREIRMESAMLLLQTTEFPVGEIAQRCGYDSHSRFSAAFKLRYGFSPSRLRKP